MTFADAAGQDRHTEHMNMAEDDYMSCMASVDAEDAYGEKVGQEEAQRLAYYRREEWQQMRDQHLESMSFERALDAYVADQQQRRDARAGLDEWPGL